MSKLCVVLLALFCRNVNAEWGQQWGSMVWGQSSFNVPMIDGVGQFIFFGLLLIIGVFVTKRWGLVKTLPAVVVLSFIPLLVDANEIQLNTFQNGEVADADEVNANFHALSNALSSSVPHIFSNGSIADADEVNNNFQSLSDDINSCLDAAEEASNACDGNIDSWVALSPNGNFDGQWFVKSGINSCIQTPFSISSVDVDISVTGSNITIYIDAFFDPVFNLIGTVDDSSGILTASGTYQSSDFSSGTWALDEISMPSQNSIYFNVNLIKASNNCLIALEYLGFKDASWW